MPGVPLPVRLKVLGGRILFSFAMLTLISGPTSKSSLLSLTLVMGLISPSQYSISPGGGSALTSGMTTLGTELDLLRAKKLMQSSVTIELNKSRQLMNRAKLQCTKGVEHLQAFSRYYCYHYHYYYHCYYHYYYCY